MSVDEYDKIAKLFLIRTCVESFEATQVIEWTTKIMFIIYILGTSPLLRSYIAEMSSDENRSSAYSLTSAAMIMSIIVGPGILRISLNWFCMFFTDCSMSSLR